MVVLLKRILRGLATFAVTRAFLHNPVRKTISTLVSRPLTCPLALRAKPNQPKSMFSYLSLPLNLIFFLQFMFGLLQKPNNYARFTHKRAAMRPCYRQQLGQSFYLQQQLDSLNGSDSCFGDGSGNATGHKVFHKANHRVRHGWLFLMAIWDCWLFQTLPRSSRKPYAPPSGRGTPMCLNICGAIIARLLSDGFTVCQTVKRGWINFRG